MRHFRKDWSKFLKAVVPLILVALVAIAIPAGAGAPEDAKKLQLAPLNPDFEAYWEEPPEASYGYIPPPMDLSHLQELPIQQPEPLAQPSSFDWRDYGKVTSVKNQNPCGTCWDFATTSVLESAILVGESATYDFSEQSVALCVDRSWVYLYDDPDDPCMGGGWSWLASEVYTKKGSVLETCNPYNPSALNCDGTCVCNGCPSVKYVDGYRLVTNDGSQISTIKNAIYNQGPVTVAYYHDFGYEYWDPTWGAIYDCYPCSEYANHLISIIGWDDDVPHPNPSHTGTGAWIVKNSWGTADPWAGGAGVSNGYFYLAYDSSCAEEVAYLKYKDYDPSEELLYWDEAGLIGAAGYGDDTAWMANVFTAPQDGAITHVDFWTTSSNADYEIYVWNGFFGTERAHQTGSCLEQGYYSIPLSDTISMPAGHQFTVGVKMTTPGYNYPIPVEYEITGDVEPTIQSGVSFARDTSSDPWEDLANWLGGAYHLNACLRARIYPCAMQKVYLPLIMKNYGPAPPPEWVTILSEDFEGSFPDSTWDVQDNDPDSGLYYWGKRDCRDNGGSYSAWCVGAGDTTLNCGSDYPNDVYAWMIHGPFSLADATAADLTFDWWSKTEYGFDGFFWGASIDGNTFYGTVATGDQSSWTTGELLDLSDVPTLGNLLGENQVWIAFVFISDYSITYEGSYVDNVLLRKMTGAGAGKVAPRTPPSRILRENQSMEPAKILLSEPGTWYPLSNRPGSP